MTDYSAARKHMVDSQVRTCDVTDLRLIEAMNDIPRERFVPAGREAQAYLDRDVPISADPGETRCLLKPMVIARMLQAAAIQPTDKVLVVGSATGYVAALADELGGEVFALEADDDLSELGRQIVVRLVLEDIKFVTGDLTQGYAAAAPYDVIIMDGASETGAHALTSQLAEGGRMVGLFAQNGTQMARLFTRIGGHVGEKALFYATGSVLPGFARKMAFVF